MPRGQKAEVGTETVNANGYTQVKTATGWVGKHTLVLEEKLGRKLVPGERAIFKDGDRTNLKPENIELAVAGNAKTLQARRARYEAEIQDRRDWIEEIDKQLKELLSN
jgi:hypothetical protein